MIKQKITLVLGDNGAFDEGEIEMMIWYCPIGMYNKHKPEKYRVLKYILNNAKYYFIYHIDV